METTMSESRGDHVLKRAMWLYGAHTVLNNAAYLVGFYFLPEGLLRGSPQVAVVGEMVSRAGSFWSELGLTLLMNVVVQCGLIVVANLVRVKRLPVGYLLVMALGLFGGLIAGTNSFAASNLTRYNAWQGMALGLSIGGLEMFGYALVAAATANLTVEQYSSWRKWKPDHRRRFRDLRLTRPELVILAIALTLFLVAAWRETAMVLGG